MHEPLPRRTAVQADVTLAQSAELAGERLVQLALSPVHLAQESPEPLWLRLRDQARDEIYALLTAPLESDPEMVLEREEKRQARELRRQCDRMRLEESLGWDADLIKELGL